MPSTQIPKLGSCLKKRRIGIGAGRRDVALAARISDNYYGSIERGRVTPPNSTLLRILNALKFGATEIVQLQELAAVNRGQEKEDAGLPDEVSALISEVRRAAYVMPIRFVRELRARIREISD